MADLQTVRVFGFAGSLRKGSYNRMALRAAGDLLPPGMTLETFDLTPIPPYNEDVRALGFPAPVQEFRDRIAAADALLHLRQSCVFLNMHLRRLRTGALS